MKIIKSLLMPALIAGLTLPLMGCGKEKAEQQQKAEPVGSTNVVAQEPPNAKDMLAAEGITEIEVDEGEANTDVQADLELMQEELDSREP